MMSPNITNTPVSLFHLVGRIVHTPGHDVTIFEDPDGGLSDDPYPDTPYLTTAAAAQCINTERSEDQDNRVTTINTWLFGFNSNPFAKINDKITFTQGGSPHIVFVNGFLDAGGQSQVWELSGVEHL